MDLNYNTYNDTEVVDLSSASTCNKFLDYPNKHYGAASGFLGNNLTICGGANKTMAMDMCYTYDMYAQDGWIQLCTMNIRRVNHAIAKFPNGSLWITGRVMNHTIK